MSMDRCIICNAMVDTDADPDCYADVSRCVCKNCRDEYNGPPVILEIGKRYSRHDDTGARISFPFKEEVGEYLGTVPSGWLEFKLSENRKCIINGGNYLQITD